MAEVFLPNLTAYNIRYLRSGWSNDVYALNSEWILRFPRRKDVVSNFKKEVRLSSFLTPQLKQTGVSIPEVITISPPEDGVFPYSFGAYPMIPGIPGDTYVRPATDWLKFAKTLGKFLTTLHSIPASDMRTLDIPSHRYLRCFKWWDQRADIAIFIDSLQDGDLSKNAEWLIDTKPPEPYSGQLRFNHNDLYPENILLDPKNGSLTGVIDWEDAAFTDPVADFIMLPFWMGWENTQLVINYYSLELDSGFQERLRFASRILSLASLYSGGGPFCSSGGHGQYEESRRSDDVSIRKWYVRNVFNEK